MSEKNEAKAQEFLKEKKEKTKELVRKGQDKAGNSGRQSGPKVGVKGQSTSEPRYRASWWQTALKQKVKPSLVLMRQAITPSLVYVNRFLIELKRAARAAHLVSGVQEKHKWWLRSTNLKAAVTRTDG